jgi:hypothetical protein
MTGKRPRPALSRTTSVSQLGSGGNLDNEFSPLPENPKEKLKPTIVMKEASPPRVVIGFECPNSTVPLPPAPSSPKGASPRSVLNSLFSRHQRVVKPVEGVGLSIALQDDHIAIPVREECCTIPVPVQHQRRHSDPIPTPAISPGRGVSTKTGPPPPPRAFVAWMEPEVDRRDTFLLQETPVISVFKTHFLDECSFCKRHLPEDKDIFMYRGDKAFCSVECRSQQMILDERSKNSSSFKGASTVSVAAA